MNNISVIKDIDIRLKIHKDIDINDVDVKVVK